MATGKTKVRRGRRYSLTAEMAEKIQMMVLMGVRPHEAAMANGLDQNCWWTAMNGYELGEDEEITERMKAIMVAEAEFIARKEAQLAGVSDWKASLEILKARRPEVYGNKVQTTITQSPDQAAMSLDKEELIAEAKRRGLPTSIFGKKG